jgi:hypothetical protein
MEIDGRDVFHGHTFVFAEWHGVVVGEGWFAFFGVRTHY